MRISDWSSDVCSSDLFRACLHGAVARAVQAFDGDALAVEEVGQLEQDARLVRRHHLDDVGQQVGLHGLRPGAVPDQLQAFRSEEHTSELQSLMRISYAVFCLKKQTKTERHIRKTK